MPVFVNNIKKLSSKREKLSCDLCSLSKVCIRQNGTNICRSCFNKNHRATIICNYCEICSHLASKDEMKSCFKCKKEIGTCCSGLYDCETLKNFCKNCYKYKCIHCDTILPQDRAYVYGVGNKDDNAPLCEPCKASNFTRPNFNFCSMLIDPELMKSIDLKPTRYPLKNITLDSISVKFKDTTQRKITDANTRCTHNSVSIIMATYETINNEPHIKTMTVQAKPNLDTTITFDDQNRCVQIKCDENDFVQPDEGTGPYFAYTIQTVSVDTTKYDYFIVC